MSHPDGPRIDGHPDADDLALVALGEHLDDAANAHIAGCAACTTQVESFRSTIDLAGLSDYGRDAPAPGEHVWAAIAADLGFAADPAAANPAAGPMVPDQGVAVPLPTSRTLPTSAAAPARPTTPTRRWTRWVVPIAAAVAGIVLGAAAVILVQNRENSVTVDATAPLTPVQGGPLPPSDGQLGTAELVTARSGQQVRVDAAGLPATTSTAYEVWLFGDDGRMVSLGTLADGSGSFTVPAGIDTSEYRTVDISDELPDGDPAHSGISLVRGTFA